jgi:peptidoglycan/LPS O-acetylase OafA/YrhL
MTETVVQAEELRGKGVSANPSGRIPELDGLRGLAILLVVISHYIGSAEHAPLGFWKHHALTALSIGWSGVDLFFVLSGFLIGGILLDAREAPNYFRTFYIRRIHRILPIYYLWIVIYGALVGGAVWLLPGRYPVAAKDLLQIPLYVLFLQNMHYTLTPFQRNWFSVTWSLAVEEQFYLLAPPLIRFLSLRRMVWVLTATICLAPMLRLLVFRYVPQGNYAAVLTMPCRADALAFGILIAMAWREGEFRGFLEAQGLLLQRVLLGLLLGVAGLLYWLVRPINTVTILAGYTWLAFFYGCLLVVVLSQTQGWVAGVMRWRMLRRLGVVSYCVYIVHDTLNQLLHRIVLHAPPQIYNVKGVGVSLLALAVTLGVASLSWRYFEKPLIGRGHSYSYWEKAAA